MNRGQCLATGITAVALLFCTAPVRSQRVDDIIGKLGQVPPVWLDDTRIGRFLAESIDKRTGLSNDTAKNSRVTAIGERITAANRIRNPYDFAVLASQDFNACSIFGGHVRINAGLLDDTQNNDAEAAFAIAHEIAHNELRHNREAVNQFRIKYALDLAGITRKSPKLMLAAANAVLARRSRDHETAADHRALEYMEKADYKLTGAIAMARRIEAEHTIAQKAGSQRGLIAQRFSTIFDTHPEPARRAEMAEDHLFDQKYGTTFRAVAGVNETRPAGPFQNTDSAWVAAYQQDTGWSVHHLGDSNPYEPQYRGECTWFVYAVRADTLPTKGRGHAEAWLRVLQEAGYGTGPTPKPGAIAVWDDRVSSPYGHVALVTKVREDGLLEVWDSNWGPEAGNTIYTDGKVRRRTIDPREGNNRFISGYVYWPDGRTEPPVAKPAPPSSLRQLCIIKDQFHIGDDRSQTEMERDATFTFSKVSATLKLWVKGSPFKDPIMWINRHEVGRVVTTDDKWHLFTFGVPAEYLTDGRNLFHIESFIPDRQHTFDDCEVRDVWIVAD